MCRVFTVVPRDGAAGERRPTHAGSDDGVESGRRGFVRWRVLGLGLLIVAACATGAGASWPRERSRIMGVEQAREAMNAGRLGVARERLARLAERFQSDGEVHVLLGECELARGNREDALAAWARVAPSSEHFGRAALLRATHLINSGRYTPAEEILLQALVQPARPERYELERALSRLYRFQGRSDDVRRVLRGSWTRALDRAGDPQGAVVSRHHVGAGRSLAAAPWRRPTTLMIASGSVERTRRS